MGVGLYLIINNMASQHLYKLKNLFIENAMKKHPNYPVDYIATPKYLDTTANGLTRCITDFLMFSEHQAERISNTGRYIDNTEIVTNVLGHQRTIGSGQYIKGTGTNGTADISATIKGRSVKIEVKIGKDRQSEAQKQYEQSVIDAGGQYWIAKDFDSFYFHYESFLDYIKC
jgi:hypothetical protein